MDFSLIITDNANKSYVPNWRMQLSLSSSGRKGRGKTIDFKIRRMAHYTQIPFHYPLTSNSIKKSIFSKENETINSLLCPVY